MNKNITFPTIIALVLSGCGGGDNSAPSSSSPISQYGEVKYDISQAFKDYSQSSAILNLAKVTDGVTHEENYRLLINRNDQVLDYKINAEPVNSASKCQLAPFSPSLKANTTYMYDNAMNVTKLGNEELYLIQAEGFPAKYNENTCQYVEVNRYSDTSTSKNILAISNKNGVIQELDFSIHKIIAKGDKSNTTAHTLVVSEDGAIYQLSLNSASNAPEVKKIASTSTNRWEMATSNYFVTGVKDYNIKLYSLENGQEYNFVAKTDVKDLQVISVDGLGDYVYTSYYADSKYYVLKVEPSTGKVVNSDEMPALFFPKATYTVNSKACEITMTQTGTTYKLYQYKDADLFQGELSTVDIGDFFVCESYNHKALAVSKVDKTNTSDEPSYNLYTFTSDKVVAQLIPFQVANDSVFISAGENYLGATNPEAYKLDATTGTPVLLSQKANLPQGLIITSVVSTPF